MKIILTIFIVCICLSCSKSNDDKKDNKNYKVKAVVWNEVKNPGSSQEYWKPGVIFDRAIKTAGTAVVSWYFPAGWINGNPSNHYTHTLNIIIDGSKNSYFEFSDWKVDFTMRPDSIKLESIQIDGGYNLTKEN